MSPATPLFGFIGRLDHQKGVDLLMAATAGFLQGPPVPRRHSESNMNAIQCVDPIQLIALGCGEEYLEEALKGLQASNNKQPTGPCFAFINAVLYTSIHLWSIVWVSEG